MGPEIPFELGQFLLYKGHFLNLIHFPIWKVQTKHLLLKYDTVLADTEIAWEATDEVILLKNNSFYIEYEMDRCYRECSTRTCMMITYLSNVN